MSSESCGGSAQTTYHHFSLKAFAKAWSSASCEGSDGKVFILISPKAKIMAESMSLVYAIVGIVVMALAVGAIIAAPKILALQNNGGKATASNSREYYKTTMTNCMHKCNSQDLCPRLHIETFEGVSDYACSCVTC